VIARLVAGLVIVAAAAPAHAQRAPSEDDTARARAADDSARTHYEAHEYAEAIADYRRAYDALPDPLYLFDIAQAYRKLGDCTNAATFYRNYLREHPTADNRDKVQRFITEMDACVMPSPTTRIEATPAAEPGATDDHALVVREPTSQRVARTAGMIAAGAGLAIVGLGVYFSNDAAGRASELERACMHGCDAPNVSAIDEAGKTANERAIASYVIGGAAVATGVGLYLWATFHTTPQPLIVTPIHGGASVSTMVRF
jgi:tetratricopeptide (TPR) repeat protein